MKKARRASDLERKRLARIYRIGQEAPSLKQINLLVVRQGLLSNESPCNCRSLVQPSPGVWLLARSYRDGLTMVESQPQPHRLTTCTRLANLEQLGDAHSRVFPVNRRTDCFQPLPARRRVLLRVVFWPRTWFVWTIGVQFARDHAP